MIGHLRGTLLLRGADHVVIEVRGVGYVVHVSERVLGGLPGPGEAVGLWTEMVVREDLMQLYGFETLAEKEWHRALTTVQGVGAKAATAILGALAADGLGRAIAIGDWSAVARAKGIGPKTAQRVVAELKDKAAGLMAVVEPASGGFAPAAPSPGGAELRSAPEMAGGGQSLVPRVPAGAAVSEALSALANLGYAPGEAAGAVATAQEAGTEAETGALLRAALKLLAPGR